MKISIFGLGYVGAVSCGCLSDLGHEVIGVDVNETKVDRINRGESPIVEDGLSEILAKAKASGRLRATTDAADAVGGSDVALVCVGTPSTPTGGVNAVYLENVSREIGDAVRTQSPDFYAVLNRSTSLPGIHRTLQGVLADASGRAMGDGIGYCCHPEFLREGAAVEDFYHPPKIVFGATDARTEAMCRELYPGIDAQTFFIPPDVAAMVKYADNCFHALKVTFGNEIGAICGAQGIDSHAVMDVFCQDHKLNISARYLKPGTAFGGSCLPKDLRGILDASRETACPLPMLAGMLDSNRVQIDRLVRRVAGSERPAVGVVGLAFKEGTDDVRESPVVSVVEQLAGKGHAIRIYDKHLVMPALVGANLSFALQAIPHLAELLTDDLQSVVDHADVLLVTHRLARDAWANVTFGPDLRVLDLVNIQSLHDLPGYEGLYW